MSLQIPAVPPPMVPPMPGRPLDWPLLPDPPGGWVPPRLPPGPEEVPLVPPADWPGGRGAPRGFPRRPVGRR